MHAFYHMLRFNCVYGQYDKGEGMEGRRRMGKGEERGEEETRVRENQEKTERITL